MLLLDLLEIAWQNEFSKRNSTTEKDFVCPPAQRAVTLVSLYWVFYT